MQGQDAPWRAASSTATKPLPKIHLSPLLSLPQNPHTDYALSLIKHPDPIAYGLGTEGIVEAAGPECVVPGQNTPVKLLGLKVHS
ncbi:hypothetical protein HanPI659440_Chr03g0115221 [Helianthus annuus]|nr:hypothetical protein HanPI659440_Chr03g0115221 [Helianthus annuus]